jgi:hypothetical protein
MSAEISNDDKFYEIALSELKTGKTVASIAARALASADGDKGKAAAQYIKMRVAQLQKEMQKQSAQNDVASIDSGYKKVGLNTPEEENISDTKQALKTKNSALIIRIIGAAIIIFNLWATGEYNITGYPLFFLTFGVAIICEYLVSSIKKNNSTNMVIACILFVFLFVLNLVTISSHNKSGNNQLSKNVKLFSQPAPPRFELPPEAKYYVNPNEKKQEHYAKIYAAHPNADAMVESADFSGWIKSKPTQEQEIINHILSQGNAQQVIDMLSSFNSFKGNELCKTGNKHARSDKLTDRKEAIKFWNQGIELGNGCAYVSLGWEYMTGRIGPTDYAKAASLNKKGGEIGDAEGFNNLGWLHENGLGVNQDKTMALYYYKKALDGCYSNSRCNEAKSRYERLDAELHKK